MPPLEHEVAQHLPLIREDAIHAHGPRRQLMKGSACVRQQLFFLSCQHDHRKRGCVYVKRAYMSTRACPPRGAPRRRGAEVLRDCWVRCCSARRQGPPPLLAEVLSGAAARQVLRCGSPCAARRGARAAAAASDRLAANAMHLTVSGCPSWLTCTTTSHALSTAAGQLDRPSASIIPGDVRPRPS